MVFRVEQLADEKVDPASCPVRVQLQPLINLLTVTGIFRDQGRSAIRSAPNKDDLSQGLCCQTSKTIELTNPLVPGRGKRCRSLSSRSESGMRKVWRPRDEGREFLASSPIDGELCKLIKILSGPGTRLD